MASDGSIQQFAAEVHAASRAYAIYLARLRALANALADRPELAREVEWRTHAVIALTALKNAGAQLVPSRPAPAALAPVVECLRGVEAETESLAAEFVGQASAHGAEGLASGQLVRISEYLRRASLSLAAGLSAGE